MCLPWVLWSGRQRAIPAAWAVPRDAQGGLCSSLCPGPLPKESCENQRATSSHVHCWASTGPHHTQPLAAPTLLQGGTGLAG